MTRPRATYPQPPERLSEEAAGWWRTVHERFALADEDRLVLALALALEALDAMRAAQQCVADEGVTFKDRWGQVRANPANAVVRDSRAQLLMAWKQLGLMEAGTPGK